MKRKPIVYKVKYNFRTLKDRELYAFGAKQRDDILRMMKNNSDYSKISSKIYKNYYKDFID